MKGSTIEAHTPTQLAQEAEDESESSEPPRSPGTQHSERMETGIEESSGPRMGTNRRALLPLENSQILSPANCHPPYLDGRGAAVALTAAPVALKPMEDLPHSVTYIKRMRGTRLHSALWLL